MILHSQVLDTIPMRSIYVNDFCIGDSVKSLFEVFGSPQKEEKGVVDEAIENSQPSKNIYHYGKNVYFSEPYEISEGRIGEFFNYKNDTIGMELRIKVDSSVVVFKIGDTLDVKKLARFFPKSFNYMETNYLRQSKRTAYLYIIPSQQGLYFKYPYPLITSIVLYYKDNSLIGFNSRYFIE